MTSYNVDNIKDMVQQDLDISQKLLSLLKQETPSIQQRDYQSVKQILLDKAPLLDQLKKHADIRKEWLRSLYKVADEHNWHEFISSFENQDIQTQWEQVNNNINECKIINETNGIMITRGQKTYSQLLTLLKGGIPETELYTAKGNKQSKGYNCTYTKA